MFSYEYCEIFKNTYFEEHLRTGAYVTTALIVLLLSFVLIHTYKTFLLLFSQLYMQTKQQKLKNMVT